MLVACVGSLLEYTLSRYSMILVVSFTQSSVSKSSLGACMLLNRRITRAQYCLTVYGFRVESSKTPWSSRSADVEVLITLVFASEAFMPYVSRY
jgi:hypothetical protein